MDSLNKVRLVVVIAYSGNKFHKRTELGMNELKSELVLAKYWFKISDLVEGVTVVLGIIISGKSSKAHELFCKGDIFK